MPDCSTVLQVRTRVAPPPITRTRNRVVMSSPPPPSELEVLRSENRLLLEQCSTLRRQLATQESKLVRVVMTLDTQGQFHLKQGVDFDDSLSSALDRLFTTPTKILRAAIPYVTEGGYRDFAQMISHALSTTADIRLLFRYPNRAKDLPIYDQIAGQYQREMDVGKIGLRFLGEPRRAGLHAKVVIRDEDEAIVSSVNWTGYALSSNAEAGLGTTSKRAVRMLAKWFDFSFEGAATLAQVHGR
jgi:phosphatidylserine/phosphatidylglycerophosphate/cardiolipin synthase-like enzyme